MPTYRTSDTGSQDGFTTGSGSSRTWDETGVTLGTAGDIGLRFKISSSSSDSEGRLLNPARLYSPFTLTLYTTNTLGGTYRLFIVPESAPAAYGTTVGTDFPRDRLDKETTAGGTGALKDSLGTELTSATVTITVASADTAVSWTDLDIYSLLLHTNISDWNGYICLTILRGDFSVVGFHSSRAANSAYVPTLVTNEVAFHTGILQGPAVGHRARSRLCPRTGLPVSSDEMVRDGYSEGLMVSPEAWDPEAPDDEYVPNPHEGVVDDEV